MTRSGKDDWPVHPATLNVGVHAPLQGARVIELLERFGREILLVHP